MNKALEEEPHFKFSVIFEKKENKKKTAFAVGNCLQYKPLIQVIITKP